MYFPYFVFSLTVTNKAAKYGYLIQVHDVSAHTSRQKGAEMLELVKFFLCGLMEAH